MTDEAFKKYLYQHNIAIQRYAKENNINPEEVVNLLALGELEIKETE